MRTETLCNYGELAKQHVQQLCYPRRVGTEGERRAADYIEAQMRQAGLQVRREIFPVFASFREWQHRLLFAGCAILAVVGALALGHLSAGFAFGLGERSDAGQPALAPDHSIEPL
jgi:hypothetical protein